MREIGLSHTDLLALAEDVLGQGGILRFRARGGSMRPLIHDGNPIALEPASPAQLRVGDVILYRTGQNAIVHRLVGYDGQALLIRGDAGRACAPDRVLSDQVLGRVCQVQRGNLRHDPRQR